MNYASRLLFGMAISTKTPTIKILICLLVVALPLSAISQMSFDNLEHQFLTKMSFSTIETNASKHGFDFKKAKQVQDTGRCFMYYLFEKESGERKRSLIAYTKCSSTKSFMLVNAVKLVLFDRDEFNTYLDECRANREITYEGEYVEDGVVSYIFRRNTVVFYSFKIRPGDTEPSYSILVEFNPTYK